MSFRRDYKPLFSIRVLDDSTGNAINNVKIVPSDECAGKLADHQLLVKKRPHGLQVYYSSNPWVSPSLLAPIGSRTRFDFVLQLPRDFYVSYLPDIPGNKKLHLHNLANDGSVKPGNTVSISNGATVSAGDALFIFSKRFEVDITVPVGAVEYEVRPQFGNTVVTTIPVETLGEGELKEFELKNVANGRYRLSADNEPGTVTPLFLENQLAAKTLQGVLSIYLETSQLSAPVNGYEYEARFATR